jgi:hypothetical protein
MIRAMIHSLHRWWGAAHTVYAPRLYLIRYNSCPNRARIANPADGPDQFHAKMGYFRTRLSGKAFYRIIRRILAVSIEI